MPPALAHKTIWRVSGSVQGMCDDFGSIVTLIRLERIVDRSKARGRVLADTVNIREATGPADASAIAEIHLTARREAMPCLARPHSDNETRDYFARVVGDRPAAWWGAHRGGEIVMRINREDLDHLYGRPDWQRRGVGSSLLYKAKLLSPQRLELWTFQCNTNARAFYEARGFHVVDYTNGRNEENEPDVKYEWTTER